MQDIYVYIRSCQKCQQMKNPSTKPNGELHSVNTHGPWDMLAIDLSNETTAEGKKQKYTTFGCSGPLFHIGRVVSTCGGYRSKDCSSTGTRNFLSVWFFNYINILSDSGINVKSNVIIIIICNK